MPKNLFTRPAGRHYLVVREELVLVCDGDPVAAGLLHEVGWRHSEDYDDEYIQLSWKDLEKHVFYDLAGRKRMEQALEILESKGFIERHAEPGKANWFRVEADLVNDAIHGLDPVRESRHPVRRNRVPCAQEQGQDDSLYIEGVKEVEKEVKEESPPSENSSTPETPYLHGTLKNALRSACEQLGIPTGSQFNQKQLQALTKRDKWLASQGRQEEHREALAQALVDYAADPSVGTLMQRLSQASRAFSGSDGGYQGVSNENRSTGSKTPFNGKSDLVLIKPDDSPARKQIREIFERFQLPIEGKVHDWQWDTVTARVGILGDLLYDDLEEFIQENQRKGLNGKELFLAFVNASKYKEREDRERANMVRIQRFNEESEEEMLERRAEQERQEREKRKAEAERRQKILEKEQQATHEAILQGEAIVMEDEEIYWNPKKEIFTIGGPGEHRPDIKEKQKFWQELKAELENAEAREAEAG